MNIIPFICVNYDSEEETIKYIDNVFTLNHHNIARIVIVDNSPLERSFKILENFIKNSTFKDSIFLLRVDNLGYFNGLNKGITFSKLNFPKIDYMIVGNNDITFKDNFITELLGLETNKNTLVLAPDVITTEGYHENPHVINKMSFLRILKYDIFFSNFYVAKFLRLFKPNDRPKQGFDPNKKNIFMGIGALYILTPNFFKYFDELWDQVFLYGEEAILTGQIQSVKGNISYEPSLVCYHNESSTTSKINEKAKYKIVQKSYKIYRKYL